MFAYIIPDHCDMALENRLRGTKSINTFNTVKHSKDKCNQIAKKKKKNPFVSLTFPRLWRIFSHVRNLYSKDSLPMIGRGLGQEINGEHVLVSDTLASLNSNDKHYLSNSGGEVLGQPFPFQIVLFLAVF